MRYSMFRGLDIIVKSIDAVIKDCGHTVNCEQLKSAIEILAQLIAQLESATDEIFYRSIAQIYQELKKAKQLLINYKSHQFYYQLYHLVYISNEWLAESRRYNYTNISRLTYAKLIFNNNSIGYFLPIEPFVTQQPSKFPKDALSKETIIKRISIRNFGGAKMPTYVSKEFYADLIVRTMQQNKKSMDVITYCLSMPGVKIVIMPKAVLSKLTPGIASYYLPYREILIGFTDKFLPFDEIFQAHFIHEVTHCFQNGMNPHAYEGTMLTPYRPIEADKKRYQNASQKCERNIDSLLTKFQEGDPISLPLPLREAINKSIVTKRIQLPLNWVRQHNLKIGQEFQVTSPLYPKILITYKLLHADMTDEYYAIDDPSQALAISYTRIKELLKEYVAASQEYEQAAYFEEFYPPLVMQQLCLDLYRFGLKQVESAYEDRFVMVSQLNNSAIFTAIRTESISASSTVADEAECIPSADGSLQCGKPAAEIHMLNDLCVSSREIEIFRHGVERNQSFILPRATLPVPIYANNSSQTTNVQLVATSSLVPVVGLIILFVMTCYLLSPLIISLYQNIFNKRKSEETNKGNSIEESYKRHGLYHTANNEQEAFQHSSAMMPRN